MSRVHGRVADCHRWWCCLEGSNDSWKKEALESKSSQSSYGWIAFVNWTDWTNTEWQIQILNDKDRNKSNTNSPIGAVGALLFQPSHLKNNEYGITRSLHFWNYKGTIKKSWTEPFPPCTALLAQASAKPRVTGRTLGVVYKHEKVIWSLLSELNEKRFLP